MTNSGGISLGLNENGKTSETTDKRRRLPWQSQSRLASILAFSQLPCREPAEAEALALSLVEESLPPCVQAFLLAVQQHSLAAQSVEGRAPTPPALTAEEKAFVSLAVRSLSEILQPAREGGPELEKAVGAMMAVMNVYTGDQAKALAAGCRMVSLPRGLSAVRHS